jgi:hypothetical protein
VKGCNALERIVKNVNVHASKTIKLIDDVKTLNYLEQFEEANVLPRVKA